MVDITPLRASLKFVRLGSTHKAGPPMTRLDAKEGNALLFASCIMSLWQSAPQKPRCQLYPGGSWLAVPNFPESTLSRNRGN
jgi:hypothetical protein